MIVQPRPPSCAQVLRTRRWETMESSPISPAFIMASRASLARLSASGRKVWGLPHRFLSLVGIPNSNRTSKAPVAWPFSWRAECAARRTVSIHLLALASAVDTTLPRQSLGLGCGRGVPLAWKTIMAQGYRTERTLQGWLWVGFRYRSRPATPCFPRSQGPKPEDGLYILIKGYPRFLDPS